MNPKKTSDGDKPIEGSDAATSPLAAPAPIPAIAPPAPAFEAAKTELRTPAEWAAKNKLTKPRDPRLPQSTDWVHPSHAVADKLYGWSEDAYNYQPPEHEPFVLSESDYRAGVRAAMQFPVVAPHAAAVPPPREPHIPPRFANFVPKKSGKAKPADKSKEST